jgi:glycosyltransferase involved in cell wall biosynthesis
VRIAVLMPAFDEGERLGRTVAELAGAGADLTLFVVDDGSVAPVDEATLAAASAGAIRIVLARHAVNLGQGAAIETARRLALDARFSGGGFDAYVTMDADGQHRAEDVLALAAAVEAGADVALGDRFAGGSNVPRARRALLAMARAFERVATGARLSDAHNGLRAFGPCAIEAMRIRQNRMAHATELTRAISRSRAALRVVEVPVSVRYTPDSMRKGQGATGAVAILVDLFQGFLFETRR